MKQIYTSYYANMRKLNDDMNPVGISIGKNKYLKQDIPYDLRLAPTWAMMKMSDQDYDWHMSAKLARMDAEQIYNELPENAVLLCYEKFNDRCHRRMVAEWFENELGIIVPEYGLKREESFPYAETGTHNKGVKRTPEINLSDSGQFSEEPKPNIPESVRKRQESYKQDKENMTIFDFL